MTGFLGDIGRTAKRLFDWWIGELVALVPERLRRALASPRPNLVLVLEDGRVSVLRGDPRRNGKQSASAGRAGDLELNAMETLERLSRARPQPTVGLRVPYRDCFERRTGVPAAARRDLRRILELELERATPLKTADVYSAYLIDHPRSRRGTLAVRHLIVKHSTVAPAIARIEAAGARVVQLDCWSADGSEPLPINFLEYANGYDKDLGERSLIGAKILTGAAVFLMISAIVVTTSRHEQARASLTQETAAARVKAQTVLRQIDNFEAALRRHHAAVSVLLQRTSSVRILDEVTRLLSDTAWLTDFSLARSMVEISGFANEAAGLIPIFERSKVFARASLSAPVAFDPATDKERFSIRLHLADHPDAGGLQIGNGGETK